MHQPRASSKNKQFGMNLQSTKTDDVSPFTLYGTSAGGDTIPSLGASRDKSFSQLVLESPSVGMASFGQQRNVSSTYLKYAAMLPPKAPPANKVNRSQSNTTIVQSTLTSVQTPIDSEREASTGSKPPPRIKSKQNMIIIKQDVLVSDQDEEDDSSQEGEESKILDDDCKKSMNKIIKLTKSETLIMVNGNSNPQNARPKAPQITVIIKNSNQKRKSKIVPENINSKDNGESNLHQSTLLPPNQQLQQLQPQLTFGQEERNPSLGRFSGASQQSRPHIAHKLNLEVVQSEFKDRRRSKNIKSGIKLPSLQNLKADSQKSFSGNPNEHITQGFKQGIGKQQQLPNLKDFKFLSHYDPGTQCSLMLQEPQFQVPVKQDQSQSHSIQKLINRKKPQLFPHPLKNVTPPPSDTKNITADGLMDEMARRTAQFFSNSRNIKKEADHAPDSSRYQFRAAETLNQGIKVAEESSRVITEDMQESSEQGEAQQDLDYSFYLPQNSSAKQSRISNAENIVEMLKEEHINWDVNTSRINKSESFVISRYNNIPIKDPEVSLDKHNIGEIGQELLGIEELLFQDNDQSNFDNLHQQDGYLRPSTNANKSQLSDLSFPQQPTIDFDEEDYSQMSQRQNFVNIQLRPPAQRITNNQKVPQLRVGKAQV
ncbi:hypothetical protein FGO68_gene16026 [Halteria grandinella]|uniref:Uncharacterized protein n=1 Tax=Halteria grandinella TaxID=5974 RepID=A0A8J8NXL2_HALGN|nr:hypothetical protein FGO68_gene16026 [Halteria grandinella]